MDDKQYSSTSTGVGLLSDSLVEYSECYSECYGTGTIRGSRLCCMGAWMERGTCIYHEVIVLLEIHTIVLRYYYWYCTTSGRRSMSGWLLTYKSEVRPKSWCDKFACVSDTLASSISFDSKDLNNSHSTDAYVLTNLNTKKKKLELTERTSEYTPNRNSSLKTHASTT